MRNSRILPLLFCGVGSVLWNSCGERSETGSQVDPQLASRGTIEVVARLVEVPEGAIFKRDLYHYTTILKYEVMEVRRGEVKAGTIFVGHYNPWKPRPEAADQRVTGIGGNLRRFEAGQLHHLALEVPLDDFYMGGIVNKYFGQPTDPLYWALWTNLE